MAFLSYIRNKPLGKCVNYGSTYTMKTAGYLISSTAEFSAGMEDRKYYLRCGKS